MRKMKSSILLWVKERIKMNPHMNVMNVTVPIHIFLNGSASFALNVSK